MERVRARRDSERVEREKQVRRREARREAWPWVRARLVVEAVTQEVPKETTTIIRR